MGAEPRDSMHSSRLRPPARAAQRTCAPALPACVAAGCHAPPICSFCRRRHPQAKKDKGGAAPATPAASAEAGGAGGKGGGDDCTVDLLDIRVGQIVKVRWPGLLLASCSG